MPRDASPTLDTLFRRSVASRPGALALIDPEDKPRFTGQDPRQLTYAEADHVISVLATHFRQAGLPAGSVIAVQLPNSVEFPLTLLAAHRAGLAVALLPQLWRQSEIVTALNRTGARALVTCGQIDGVDHADLALNAAAEAFSIRHVCGFGSNLPEGLAPLDDILAEGRADDLSGAIRDGRQVGLISFDVAGNGLAAVPRTHLNLIAGGLAVSLESGVPPGAMMLSTLAPSSFGTAAASIVPWLLSGGTLSLHHPFDDAVLERQLVEMGCNVLAAPAALALRLCGSELLERAPALRHVIAAWRAPEQVASSDPWSGGHAVLTDIYLFGEVGLFGARRGNDGTPAQIAPGLLRSPHDDAGAPVTGEIVLTPDGTLALRGPMVPIAAYAANHAMRAGTPVEPAGHVDTGYTARLDPESGALRITAPPAGVYGVGGYRFLARDLQEWSQRLGQGVILTALPDRLNGHRLAGRAYDDARAREALMTLGLNPLMTDAFRERNTA